MAQNNGLLIPFEGKVQGLLDVKIRCHLGGIEANSEGPGRFWMIENNKG